VQVFSRCARKSPGREVIGHLTNLVDPNTEVHRAICRRGAFIGFDRQGGPKLNVGPSCDGATRSSINIGRDNEACMGDERDARNLLAKNWSQYSRAHKTQCVGMARGGPSSYVELISCLDVMRDAAAIYKADPLFGDFAKNPKGTPSNQPANRSPK
jgi:hypothetical protein